VARLGEADLRICRFASRRALCHRRDLHRRMHELHRLLSGRLSRPVPLLASGPPCGRQVSLGDVRRSSASACPRQGRRHATRRPAGMQWPWYLGAIAVVRGWWRFLLSDPAASRHLRGGAATAQLLEVCSGRASRCGTPRHQSAIAHASYVPGGQNALRPFLLQRLSRALGHSTGPRQEVPLPHRLAGDADNCDSCVREGSGG